MLSEINFPVDPAALLTVAGMALLSGLIGEWLKRHIPDWRWTNVVVLVVAEVVAIVTQLVATNFKPSALAIWAAMIVAFFGASVATYGYETIFNILGFLGVGKRSNAALLAKAQASVPKTSCDCKNEGPCS